MLIIIITANNIAIANVDYSRRSTCYCIILLHNLRYEKQQLRYVAVSKQKKISSFGKQKIYRKNIGMNTPSTPDKIRTSFGKRIRYKIRESMPSNIRLARMNYNGSARSLACSATNQASCRVRSERERDISGARERRPERAHPAGHVRSLPRLCVVVRVRAGKREKERTAYLGPQARRSSIAMACGSRDQDHQRCRMHGGADQLPFSPCEGSWCRHGVAVLIIIVIFAIVIQSSQFFITTFVHYSRHYFLYRCPHHRCICEWISD